ncbi:LuxR C-terminal-related transcriptional regulator [Nocardioides alkalitolerans]|uniref:LuxR C-terminal-related transcriptional regulator n=1 Tax=Nocardioides alkalitolerans TaxID=281714 RepID=UPI0003F6DF5F|nr:LuxR C-terminal-related transcriptional regulator [Nocardioides alkalitolerans]
MEDHALFAEALAIAMRLEGYDVRQVPAPDVAVSTARVVAAVVHHRPQIVLLDLDLGAFGDGARLISPLAHAGAAVVVVTASHERARWGECIRYGARKVLNKSQPLSEILSVTRRLTQGLAVMDVVERESLLKSWHLERAVSQGQRERLDRLTPREREILGHLIAGRQVREIAALRVVSESTVRTQVKTILSKLEVTSQLTAVSTARSAGWTPESPRGRR